jgi:hypothetical protein
MAVRTFVTSGVAFVAAGAVAATVALAPPMSPRDIQVAKSTEVSLNALVTDPALQELINDYFNSGVAAVVQQLLIDVVGEDGTASDVINDFFDGGTTQLTYRLLGGDFDGDPSTTPFLSTFFNINNPLGVDTENPALFGASGVSLLGLQAAAQAGLIPLPVMALINLFYEGGASAVTQALLLALAPGQAQLTNDFFEGGASQVVFRQLGGDVGTPTPSTTDPAGTLLPTSSPYLSAFFGINNNILNPDGSDSPGLFGASGVVLQGLHDGGVNSPQVDDFFEGGVPLVVQNQLEALAPNEQVRNLINGFFTIGISEVIRQILTEPPTPPADDGDDAGGEAGTGAEVQSLMKVADVSQDPDLKVAGADLKDVKPVVEKQAKVATDPVKAVQPLSAPVASPPPASSPPPAVTPAPATPVVVNDPVVKDQDPVVKPVVKDDPKGTDDNDVTDAMKDGNKVEVDPILLVGANGRGPKAGEGSWGVFGQVADAIGKAVTGAVAPPKKAPAKTEGASTGGGTGSTGGS